MVTLTAASLILINCYLHCLLQEPLFLSSNPFSRFDKFSAVPYVHFIENILIIIKGIFLNNVAKVVLKLPSDSLISPQIIFFFFRKLMIISSRHQLYFAPAFNEFYSYQLK